MHTHTKKDLPAIGAMLIVLIAAFFAINSHLQNEEQTDEVLNDRSGYSEREEVKREDAVRFG